MKKLSPDVVFVPGHGKEAGFMLKQAHALGLQATFLGGDGWGKGVLKISGTEAAEGNFFSNHWHADMDSEQSRKFVAKYKKMFGDDKIAASAALSYDSVMLVAKAIKIAGSFKRSAIKEALYKIDGFQGVTGKYRFDVQGDPEAKDAVILGYENGDIIYVGSVLH